MNLSLFSNYRRPSSLKLSAYDLLEDTTTVTDDHSALFAPAYNFANFDRPAAMYIYETNRDAERDLVQEFLSLDHDWDGYDADPISKEAGAAAHSFLSALPAGIESPELTPNASGTISMEWESERARASLELGKSKCSFYLKKHGVPTIYHSGDLKVFTSILGLLSLLSPSVSSANKLTEY